MKACCEQQAFGLSQSHNKAVHTSNPDLCHHHAMFTIRFISDYASAFFLLVVLLGFAAASSVATTGELFRIADLFSFALIAFFLLEFP